MSITAVLTKASDKVQAIYNAFYGRPADPAGLDFWVSQLNASDGDLRVILPAFGDSAESNALFGTSASSDQVVRTIYNIVLQREPDAQGLAFYKQKLDSGALTKSEVAFAIYDGIQPNDPVDGSRVFNALNIANQFTDTLRQSSTFDTNYSGDPAAQVGRELLARVTSSTSHTSSLSVDLNGFLNERLVDSPKGVVADPFDFKLVYNSSSAANFSAQFEAAFNKLEQIFFEGLPNYFNPRDGRTYDDIEIDITLAPIDGSFGTVAFAGPNDLRPDTLLPFTGSMTVDSADIQTLINDGLFDDVVIHEAMHALGFGTLWGDFNLNNTNGRYTGAQGILEYRALTGNESATFVPLEPNTIGSQDNAHWREATLGVEIMTPIVDDAPVFSSLSFGALQDLGYSVNYSQADFFMV